METVQLSGIVLWIIFYGSYQAKVYMERKKGIAVSCLARGKKALRTKMTEGFLLFFTSAAAVIQLFSALLYRRPGTAAAGDWLPGTAVSLVGIAFFLLAMREMKGNWRAGIDEGGNTAMVTGGIYRISRNPAFVGFDLFYIGYGILFPGGFMLLFALLCIFTLHLQIREEEKYMEGRYGEAYMEYKKRARRYL